MADKFSLGLLHLQNSNNGAEAREPIADILEYVNQDSGGTVKGLIGKDNEIIIYSDLMTPAQVKSAFDTGKMTIDNKEAYVYVTSIDKTITENARKKAITNKAFYSQLSMISKILDAILYTKQININYPSETEGET